MKILGIDPHASKPYGFALLESRPGCRPSVEVSGLCNLDMLANIIWEFEPDVVAIEDQYLNRNYKVAKALSWSAGKVMGVAEIAKVRWAVVNVATWKSKMGAQKGTHIQRAEELFGGTYEDDEASAVLIAAYALDNT